MMNARAGPFGLTGEMADTDASPESPAAEPQHPLNLDAAIFRDVEVAIRVRLGDATLKIEDLLALKSGSLVKLDRLLSEPVDLYLNDSLIGRGEIVALDDCFGVRVTEIATR
jgi:flagellar motor switch protein FliN/FliY